jgi:hypothetical protein
MGGTLASAQPSFPSSFTSNVALPSVHHPTPLEPCPSLEHTNMSNKPKIPSWQRAGAENPIKTLSEAEQQSEPTEPEPNTAPIVDAPIPTESDLHEPEHSVLLDQAKRFLDDATIRDAPREKKVAFLESKGVSAEDIETLLGAESDEKPTTELEAVGERAWSKVSKDA